MIAARPGVLEEEFLRLPNDGRKYELVNGEIREVPAGFQHDAIGMIVGAKLVPAAKGIAIVAGAQAGFRMLSGNIRCPDVSVTRKSRLPGGKPNVGFGDFAPDLCIEIVSPSEEVGEQAAKLREYFASGAELVWHLYPDTETVQAFTAPDVSVTLGPDEELDCPTLLPAFRCRVDELFDLD